MADAVNRSGNPYSSPRDGNRVPALFGVSTVDGVTPVPLEVNPATGALLTSSSGSGTSSVTVSDGGTTGVNVLSAGTPQSQGNAELVAPTTYSVPFSFTSVSSGTVYDVGNYKSVSVQVTSLYTGTTPTLAFQTSNDGTNWYSNVLQSSSSAQNTASSNTTFTGLFEGEIRGRYFRLNQTGAYSSGTTAGVLTFGTGYTSPATMGVTVEATSTSSTGTITTSSSSISTNSNSSFGAFAEISIYGTYAGVSFGITQSDNGGSQYFQVPIYDAIAQTWLSPGTTITLPTNASRIYYVPAFAALSITRVLSSAYTSGTANVRINYGQNILPGSTMSQIMDAAGNNRGGNVDANGNQNVATQFAPVGTKFNGVSYHITTNTTNTPTASTAYITSIAISTEVGGTTSSVTIQDKSGTPLKLVNGLATTAASTTPTVLSFNTPVLMTGGIDVITAGAVAGTVDVWVSYLQ